MFGDEMLWKVFMQLLELLPTREVFISESNLISGMSRNVAEKSGRPSSSRLGSSFTLDVSCSCSMSMVLLRIKSRSRSSS